MALNWRPMFILMGNTMNKWKIINIWEIYWPRCNRTKEISSPNLWLLKWTKPQGNVQYKKKRLKSEGQLPPRIQIHLFENLVRPILLYGSDVWGVNVSTNTPIDKLFFYYMRCVLHIKANTSNVIVIGESGQIPPSVYCPINALCYLKKLPPKQLSLHKA